MRHVRLGTTDLEVSTIAFGTWAFGGAWGSADLDDARDAIPQALSLGINLFDTAQSYGFGAAEQLLGRALQLRAEREDVIIATKGGVRPDGGHLVRDASREWLRSGVESSLRHLGTDYIDLYQVHWPDPHTPPEETAGALEELIADDDWRSRSPDFTGRTFDDTVAATDIRLSDTDLNDIDEILRDALPVQGPRPEGM